MRCHGEGHLAGPEARQPDNAFTRDALTHKDPEARERYTYEYICWWPRSYHMSLALSNFPVQEQTTDDNRK